MASYYLMRHCRPVPGARDDADRPLTPEGRKQAEEMAAWAKRIVGHVDTVITSPFLRALETAEIMAEALGSNIQRTPMVEPDAKPDEAWRHIEAMAGVSTDVLVVSHHPLVGHLLDQIAGVIGIGHTFEHGSIALVDTYTKEMRWLVSPELVERDDDEELADAAAELAEASLALAEEWVTINGQHIDIGAPLEALSKSDLAKLAYGGGTKAEQDIAEQTENELAAATGMPKSSDNKPFDLQSRKYGVEVKTMVSNTNDKITMNKAARMRKEAEAKASKLKTCTVVVDKRGDTPKYFIKAGFGSFRVGSMTEVPGVSALKAAIYRVAA
jgi:phosphohistidine phosphatase